MKRKRAFTDLGDQRGFFSFDPGGCTSGLINTTRMNAKTCGAVPMVRIHLPPARSLQTLGPQLLPKAVVESGAMVPIEIAPDNGRPRWPDRDGIIEIAFGCGARVRLRGEVSSQSGAHHVFDYKRDDVAAKIAELSGGRGVDLVFDATYSVCSLAS